MINRESSSAVAWQESRGGECGLSSIFALGMAAASVQANRRLCKKRSMLSRSEDHEINMGTTSTSHSSPSVIWPSQSSPSSPSPSPSAWTRSHQLRLSKVSASCKTFRGWLLTSSIFYSRWSSISSYEVTASTQSSIYQRGVPSSSPFWTRGPRRREGLGWCATRDPGKNWIRPIHQISSFIFIIWITKSDRISVIHAYPYNSTSLRITSPSSG